MGSSAHKIAKADSSSNRAVSRSQYTDDQGLWQDIVQTSECCGCVRTKITRKKVTWQDKFIKNCNTIQKQYPWAKDFIELVQSSTLSKRNYITDVNELKKIAFSQSLNNEEIAPPQDIQKFKKQLKQSMVVTYQDESKEIDVDHKHLKPENSFYRSKRTTRFERSHMNSMASCHLEAKLRKEVMSKVQDSFSDIMGERSVTRSTTNELQVFIKFTQMLAKHIADTFCILGVIQRSFIAYIEKTYKVVNGSEVSSATIQKMTTDITQYLELLRQAIWYFYNLNFFKESYCHNSFIANQENLLSACTTILFGDQRFYSVIFETVSMFCKEKDKKLNDITAKLAKKGPQQFMVKEKFCLNLKTLQSQCIGIKREDQDTLVSKNEEITEVSDNFAPYQDCINEIRKISTLKEPINKMKILISCSELIPRSIEAFYSKHDLQKDNWLLDADQVLSIFCYIIAKAQIPHLHTHLFMLQNFSTSHQMITVSGYYMSVVSCVVEQLVKDYEFGVIQYSL